MEALREAGRPMSFSDLVDAGHSRATLSRMVAEGAIERGAHGVYRLTDFTSQYADWAALAMAAPRAVIWLRSAASFHRITQDMPSMVEVAIPRGGARTRGGSALQVGADFIQWRSEESLTRGVSEHEIDGVKVRITDPDRTAVDMLRYSDLNPAARARGVVRVTAESSLDCLHRVLEEEKATPDGVKAMAEAFKVGDVVGPHVTSFVFGRSRGYGA